MSTNETDLKIKILGDPVLKKRARQVKTVSESYQQTLSRMARLMYSVSGVGLAAPQIGLSEALIVVDIGTGLYKLINPKITKREGLKISEEGCLSVPGINVKVKRAKKVTVTGLDEKGKPFSIEAQDLLACVFQHEIDHLNGKLIVDYASWMEKIVIEKKIKEWEANKHEGMRESKK